jgi:hypothetical protein
VDVTKPHEVQALIEKALSAFGQIGNTPKFKTQNK